MKKTLLKKIKRKIQKYKVISFDIFDTLLLRPYVKPTDLFCHMEKAFSKDGFEIERRRAEGKAFNNYKNLREDITFDMIYEEIDDKFKDMKQKEMDWEEMVLRANPELKQVYDYAKEQGKKIVIASDMYLPTEFLAKVLRKNGYDGWEKLYISGDLGKKKRSGAIYRHMIDELHIQPKDVLHIGDNSVSDYDSIRQLGGSAILYSQVITQYINDTPSAYLYYENTDHSLAKSIIIGMNAYDWIEKKCGKIRDVCSCIGYNCAGPLAYGYAKFIEQQAIKDGIDHLLFIARDGYTFKKVYEALQCKIKSTYVYANRKLRALTSLDTNTLLEHLKYTVDFCAKESEIIRDVINTTELNIHNDYEILFNKHKKIFEKILNTKRQKYDNYIKSIVSKKEKIAIVDTMAHSFSSQKLINDFTQRVTRGYYWAYTKSKYSEGIDCICYAETAYSQNRLTSGNPEIYTLKWPLMEFYFCSPEFPIDDIDNKGNPVYRAHPMPSEQKRAKLYPIIVNGVLDFVNDLNKTFKNYNCFFDFKSLISWQNCFIISPDNKYKLFFKNFPSSMKIDQDKISGNYVASLLIKDYLFNTSKAKKNINAALWKTTFQKWYLKNWGFYKKETAVKKIEKFFGFTIKSKKIKENVKKIKYLGGLWKIKKLPNCKKMYLLGIKVYCKKYKKGGDNEN